MTRPIPENRTPVAYDAREGSKIDRAETAMAEYIQAAAEDVFDHGDTITDTHPHAIAAAHMVGCAVIHAGVRIAEPLDLIAEKFVETAELADEALLVGTRFIRTCDRIADQLFEVIHRATERGLG